MAREAYIKYEGKGFWIPESFIEVLSDFICNTYENLGLNTFSQSLQKIYYECYYNRNGENIGVVNILLDNHISNQTDKNSLINIFEQTKILILSKGIELSIADLNAFENRKADDYFKSEWRYPIKTQSLVKTIDIMIQLLNGTWQSSNYGVYFVGFPKPDGMEEI
ncbi:hypothetical protein [Pedobacter sp. NJ-S-72]